MLLRLVIAASLAGASAGGTTTLLRSSSSSSASSRARPVNATALSRTQAVVTTRCVHADDPGCAPTVALQGLGGPVRPARDPQAASDALPEHAIHSSLTSCKGGDCQTITASRPAPPAGGGMAERIAGLEGRLVEKQRQDRANATWRNISELALGALKEYDAGLLRNAAKAIRERTTPEQMALRNVSAQLRAVSKKLEEDQRKAAAAAEEQEGACCPEQTAQCLACAQSTTVQEFCANLEHVKVEGCDMPIDLSKLVLPEVAPGEPLPLEDRVKVLEAAMTRKLHKRLDKIEASGAGADAPKLSGDELREKAKRLEGEIREELVKKVTKMEKRRHKSLLDKVKGLEDSIEGGGESESGSESGADAEAAAASEGGSEAGGVGGDDASGGGASEVLDANNKEAVFHLSSPGDASDQEQEGSSDADCGSGSGDRLDGGAGGFAPCAVAGSHGLDVDGAALYAGGPADVAATQPVFHKVKTLDHGALSMDLVTDLDDPPPKTRAGESSNSVPLDQIMEGSNAPKSQVVAEAVAAV